MESWHRWIGERWDAGKVLKLTSELPGMELQPEEFQSPFKVSYYYHNAGEEELEAMKSLLHDAGLGVQIIYSSNQDLDFLPERADKGKAARFLTNELNWPEDRVIVSGDSGNDLALFTQGFRGIIVANAQPELKSYKNGRVYHASRDYADGVVEGLEFWLDREDEHREDKQKEEDAS